jgi:hypothetical protein
VELDVYKEWLGIPEGPRPPDHYQLLRLVQFEDSADKIRGNYKKLNTHVRKYATGKYSVESQELLNELAKAMLCLTDAERKREYDVSLGREFEEETDAFGRRPMERLLFERKQITQTQLEDAREYASKLGLEMRDALVQLKFVEPATAAQALAEELGFPYVDLSDMIPDDSVLDRVPKSVVKQNSILPLFIDNDMLLVACVHLPTQELEEELRLRFGIPIRGVLATPLAINQGIAKYYAPGARQEVAEDVKARGGKKGKSAPAQKQPRAKPASQLSPEEQQQRKMLGIVLICWSIIGSVVIDQLVIPLRFQVPYIGLLALIVPPLTIAYVWKVYWGK